MVTIQPFQYEKTTAFKERVQIANKVNEIISLFNQLDIESKINIFNEEIAIINGKITEINNALNEVNTAVTTVEGYNTRLTSVENESISLDARLDNIEPVVSSNTAKIGVLENKDLENVKLSGNQTIEDIKTYTKSPIVPNPPNGDTSTKAVNTNWISQTGDTAPNNLVHKSGDETIDGIKTWVKMQILGPSVGEFRRYSIQPDVNTIPVTNQDTTFLAIRTTNNATLVSETYRIKPDGSASYRIFVRAVGPEIVGQFSILEITANPDGSGELKFIQPNGKSTKLV